LPGEGSEAEAFDVGEDVVGRLDPAEGLGFGVGGIDEGADVVLEIGDGAVNPAAERAVGQQAEPALDLVDPSFVRRRTIRFPKGRQPGGCRGDAEVGVKWTW
jgi:hypothetical protein